MRRCDEQHDVDGGFVHVGLKARGKGRPYAQPSGRAVEKDQTLPSKPRHPAAAVRIAGGELDGWQPLRSRRAR